MKDDAKPADYIDSAARGEFIRVGLGVLLVSFMTAHATLFSIVFARNGHDLHAIGVILSSAALPIIFFALISSEFSARIGVLATLRLAMVLCIIGFASFGVFQLLGVSIALPYCLVFGALISPTDPIAAAPERADA